MVSEFLFYEDDADKAEKSKYIGLKIEIRNLLREEFNRKILTQILLDLRKDVSGDTQKRLFKLYQDLGLEKDAFKKLESWRWEVISKGILELTRMQVEEAYPFIVKFINDRRGTIRKQAEIATVTLRPQGLSYFLDTTKYKISEWQQLKLLDVVRNKEDYEPPRFKTWLTSTNTQVVLFALRLIKYYNQNDANASLIELVKHKDRQVRQQAIECIKEFHIVEALPILKGVFPKCTVDTKLGILGTIAQLGNSSDIEFLKTISQREGNFSVKSKAVGAINTIAPESIMPTENIEYVTAYPSPVIADEKVERKVIEGDATDLEEAREGPESNISAEHPITVEFAPNPTDNQISNNDPLVTSTPMTNPKRSDKSLKEIQVEVEEVKAASFENSPTEDIYTEDVCHTAKASNFDISDIHFLPIVVADETETLSQGNVKEDDNELSKEVLIPLDVPHAEISSDPMDEELQALINEINELDFLPVVFDKEMLTVTPSSEESNRTASEALENIEGYSLSDFEVFFDEKSDASVSETDEKVAFDLEDVPIIDVKSPKVEDVLSWLMADNELREIELRYDIVPHPSDVEVSRQLIPDPIYYDEHEAYMMGLLDDLEELGDIREIPLLEELRAEERKSFIKERITGMIEKFSREPVAKRKPSLTTDNESADLPVFSVFADLFNSIDTECKLILLDEIVPVGDEKEIEFLDGLLESPDQRIRTKAQTVLKLLIAKLSHEKPESLCTKGISNIVAEQGIYGTNSEKESFDHLLSELQVSPSLAPEIFDIDFELCESLDKNYDQKILNLPVIATEVSSNDNGSSFFTSLIKFTKLFF
ncbi:hypothetical protein SAMN05421636_104261 [Pricia antarctica]|uniref:HEAT repeat-containing protein n=2 Tax=Pricia antarctica TaxID=641691 RepID=A0A1G7BR14_9FLAO|nr:hypothetical protein SAMN05421636_104261 [Pricia antarctica]